MNEIFNVIVLLAIGGVIVLWPLEAWLVENWVSLYFRYGLPVFRREINGVHQIVAETYADQLNHDDSPVKSLGFTFMPISETEIAVGRTRLSILGNLRGAFTPVRGLIEFDPTSTRVKMVGFINYFLFLAPLFFVYKTGLFASLAKGEWIRSILLALPVMVAIFFATYNLVAMKKLERRVRQDCGANTYI